MTTSLKLACVCVEGRPWYEDTHTGRKEITLSSCHYKYCHCEEGLSPTTPIQIAVFLNAVDIVRSLEEVK